MNLSVKKSACWVGRRLFTRTKETRRYPTVILQTLLVGLLSIPLGLTGASQVFAKEKTVQPATPIQSNKTNTSYAATQPTGAMTSALIPPLPFTEPEVGPLIKNSYPDDINRRTTAFIPQSLDNLTPIKFPDTDGKWIRVDLSEQIAVAYEGKKPIRAFRISSGLPNTPTVTGTFHIRTKVVSQTMTGGEGSMYYNLPGVKWVQYFYEDYSFHGTYWHNNFGHPMSHGCVNMTNADAKWLFDWAAPTWDGKTVWFKSKSDTPGTLVIIHE